jgi:hypothetical protein
MTDAEQYKAREEAAQAAIRGEAAWSSFDDWSWFAPGEPIGLMSPSEAARAAWKAARQGVVSAVGATYTTPEHGWTCFHCGETFTTVGGARDHFGAKPDAMPGCMIRVQLGDERGLLMALRRDEARLEALLALTHDDYTRLLAASTVPIELHSRAEVDGGAEWVKARAIRGRWFIAAHTARFGCSPSDCAECKDEAANMRALNCDEHGNPLDEGTFHNANMDGTDRLAAQHAIPKPEESR